MVDAEQIFFEALFFKDNVQNKNYDLFFIYFY